MDIDYAWYIYKIMKLHSCIYIILYILSKKLNFSIVLHEIGIGSMKIPLY